MTNIYSLHSPPVGPIIYALQSKQ